MASLALVSTREDGQILTGGDSYVKKVILNRPTKLNSLTFQMISEMLKCFKTFEDDPTTNLVILKGNGKAFCAGGDVVSIVIYSMMAGHWSFGASFYRKQFTLDYLLATYKKPLIALIDGIVMGGGSGLSMHATFRIVTEKTVFAMPEAAIGLFPDVGASHFLSRLPGYFGEYLGLTGARLDGAEMLECGLATHFVYSKDMVLLENEIERLGRLSDATKIMERLMDIFADKPSLKQDSAYRRLETINKCFSKETVEEILHSLEMENKSEKWITSAIKSMKSASPTSLKLTLRSIREGRMQELRECIIREYTIVCHVIRGTISNDVYEGSRAMLLDKDKKPKWEPAKLELISEDMIHRCFKFEHDNDDWEHLQLPARPSKIKNNIMQLESKL